MEKEVKYMFEMPEYVHRMLVFNPERLNPLKKAFGEKVVLLVSPSHGYALHILNDDNEVEQTFKRVALELEAEYKETLQK